MEKKTYTADELNNASREPLIAIVLSLQESLARMAENQELILEQVAICASSVLDGILKNWMSLTGR